MPTEIGYLVLCPTPIGNLADMPPRVTECLKEADLIAAEDTRNSIRLLNHFDIHTPMTSYHEYNKVDKARVLVRKMLSGTKVALITDAGMPGISDPGEELVRQCHEAGIRVSAIPGPCACVTALTISGLPTRRFCFEAFLPADHKERQEVLAELAGERRTIVLYEAPHHLEKTLAELAGVLGEDRPVSICRELTKIHEEVCCLTLGEAVKRYETLQPRGEYVLVIGGKPQEEILQEARSRWEDLTAAEHVQMYVDQGMDRKEAMKQAAKDRGVPKREIYNEIVRSS
ncbi:MAG: 16S rRNA (cytidine(1402)-2'-O)-methyltransferase [Lachnospiraceae bacterium]|jgi:16S rRNA (cytidine1402-2'-O)-methyltransferase|nr:16S rRNA (cytidine(1402)-2'-O)-methyltransferase [Lachnospiraceae bacterium]MCH4031693.1 16S rRNA (cytidine(1402)-2'-O)-methyltransferase [Lachnospiraceae bacterium]MCH4071290.1 16S rRNA (cytidine(1402)-2'-O)-methyltransferase [Lachnospiraceae bacterium]MCH4108247.1 16S rRNA (cytidine(1402)-2'-O)-methyltransferase [Lachnospiraceae bacterium]MCI1302565.1 16S rRNA (cytidine(1402)-2'-O)-methyltransferase [Lachnospiraceae bacterium]